MIKVEFGTIEKVYTPLDLPRLKEENSYLEDEIIEILEVAIHGGDYDKSVLGSQEFIDWCLLDELNSGFIKVKNKLGENSYEDKVKELRVAIEDNRGRLEDVFEFITINHGEGNFDFIKYSFEYEDIAITNPFMDETNRVSVDPIDYYGGRFVNSKIARMILGYCDWIS